MPADLEKVISKLEEAQKLKLFKEISDFPHLPHHKKRVRLFNELINAFNEDWIFIKRLKDVRNIYECLERHLKDAENQEIVDKYFDVKMAEVIQKFRDGKKILNSKISDFDKSYDKLSKELKVHQALGKAAEARNAEEKLEKMRKALNSCIRILSALKVNRAKAKKAAKSMCVVDASSFLHSIFNCKNENNSGTCTGMAGTLIKEHKYIENNIKQAKHIHSNEIKRHMKNLKDPSVKKAFMESEETYNKAVTIALQFESTKNSDDRDLNIDYVKKIVEITENEIEKSIEELINKLLNSGAVREKTIRSYLENYKAKLEELKKNCVTMLSPEYQIWVEKYIDLYASSASIEFYSIVHNAIEKRCGDKWNAIGVFAWVWVYGIFMVPAAGGLLIGAIIFLFFMLMSLTFSLIVLDDLSSGGSIDEVSKSRYNPLRKDTKQNNAVVAQNK